MVREAERADTREFRRVFGDLPVVRVATILPDGSPHVVPLWFVWREDAIYVSTRRAGRTWANATLDPRVALAFDVGREWTDLAGAMIRGRAEPLPADHPALRAPLSAWYDKYRTLLSGDGFARFTEDVADLGFLRVEPERVSAWDHAR